MNNNKKFNDPFSGYASCPDTQRAFISYSEKNQDLWIKKSEQTIQEFIDKLNLFEDFHSAYRFLAEKRHQIAVELKHRNDEGRMNYYGTFRQEGDHFRQMISAGDSEQYWKWQKNKVFELTYKLVAPTKETNKHQHSSATYEDEYIKCLQELVSVDNEQAKYFYILIKSPFIKENNNGELNILSTIELYEFYDEKLNSIRIEYTPINAYNQENYYKIADYYYQNLINFKMKDGVQDFFASAGNLAYLLSHLLLTKQGNAGITEWILRGLAFKHGIELGYFNHDEGISWDFKAILTPNRDEYVKWFYEKAFLNYKLLPSKDADQKFTFK